MPRQWYSLGRKIAGICRDWQALQKRRHGGQKWTKRGRLQQTLSRSTRPGNTMNQHPESPSIYQSIPIRTILIQYILFAKPSQINVPFLIIEKRHRIVLCAPMPASIGGAAPLQLFMSLKDFDLGPKLGQGAYSTVFRVERLADRKVYALKKVKLANLSQKEIENALNEVRILASLKNNSIVGYKEVFLQGKNLCIIMEFADDGDLYQKIVDHKKRKELFEESEIWSVLIQTVIGLKTLHTLNILHRDLKSANIFLTKAGEAKLGDLNVSKVAKNGLLYTQTGTPYYASPQVWKDEPYDSKSDIWSLGCVIYQMTTLQPPFKAQDMQGLFKSVTLGVYPPINQKYSKQLSHMIKLMLQQKPKSRPSAQKILSSALIQKKVEELHLESIKEEETSNQELMKTIRLPKKLHYLTDRLPKPNYDNLSQGDKGSSMKNSPSISKDRNLSKGSLPRINHILLPGLNYVKGDRNRKKKLNNDMLMIQGRSKIIEEARINDSKGRNLEKEIREELKRIYKVKGVKSEQHKNKRSERSIVLPPIKL